ncbi:MAG TPA: alkaline phosphatase family protein [Anaerolineae bacterium]|nr:alkaline phosphatase family protein [Anaerolineae bacterium]
MSDRSNPNRRRVMVIGLDGATFDLIRPWIEDGTMPTLQRLMNSGASGVLTTTLPPISSSAWVSFATGKNPGKHGLVDFVHPRPDSYQISIVSPQQRASQAIWNLLSDAGRKVGIVGMPVTYPPEEVNGYMISDFLTPSASDDYTYPSSLSDELEKAMGGFPLLPDERYRSTKFTDRFIADMVADVEQRLKGALYLLDNKEWDFFFLLFWSNDMLQHETWSLLDETHPSYEAQKADRYRDLVVDFHRQLDQAVGRLAEKAGPDDLIIVMSDHGFGPVHSFFLVNNWLREMGWLQLKKRPATRLKYALFRLGFTPLGVFHLAKALRLGFLRRRFRFQRGGGLMKRLFLSFADVDWACTKAFAVGSFGQIYINQAGKRPQGMVQPGKEYEELREEIAARAVEIRDPRTGSPVVERVYRKEEIYSGPQVEKAPDLVLQSRNWEYMAFGHADFGAAHVVEPIVGMSGHHRPEGIAVLSGQGIKSGATLQDANITDLAPTILYAMGIPIPSDMDGRVLTEAFAADYLSAVQVRYTNELSQRPTGEDQYSLEDEEEIKERLRGLGYVG